MLTENLDSLASKVAGSPHNYPGGNNKQAYHAVTRGWVMNKVIRRTHPGGLSAGQLWKQVLNPLLATDVFVGLPATDDHRCTDLYAYPGWKHTARQCIPELITGLPAIPLEPSHASFLQSGSKSDRSDLPPRL